MGQISFMIGAGLCKAAMEEKKAWPWSGGETEEAPKPKPKPAPKPKPSLVDRLRKNRLQVEELSGVPASQSNYKPAPKPKPKPKVEVEK